MGATTNDYMTYYRYVRAELFVCAGLQYENPGEATKKRWDNIEILQTLRFYEDLDDVLETIVSVYQQLVRHGVTIPGDDQDERRLVVDLGMKVKRSSDFRIWFYGGDAHQDITTVRLWITRAQKYRSLLSHRRKEAALEVNELGPDDGILDMGLDGDLEGSAVDAEIDETIGRLNDLRQARGGLRKSGPRPAGRSEQDKQASLAAVPQCPECKGRHRVKPCPNGYAKKDGFDSRKAEQSGTRCNYRDPVHVEVT